MLHDLEEDQFALPAGVAGIDDADDIVTTQQRHKVLEPSLLLRLRNQIELRRQDGQCLESPCLRPDALQQMTGRCGDQHGGRLEVVAVLGESAECLGDIGGD